MRHIRRDKLQIDLFHIQKRNYRFLATADDCNSERRRIDEFIRRIIKQNPERVRRLKYHSMDDERCVFCIFHVNSIVISNEIGHAYIELANSFSCASCNKTSNRVTRPPSEQRPHHPAVDVIIFNVRPAIADQPL